MTTHQATIIVFLGILAMSTFAGLSKGELRNMGWKKFIAVNLDITLSIFGFFALVIAITGATQ